MGPRAAFYGFFAAGVFAWALLPATLESANESGGAGGSASASGGAEAGAAKPASLAALIQALGSARYREREQATVALLCLPAQRQSDIEDALARETDAEVIARLTRAAVHLMLKARTRLDGPVSLLGITLGVEGVRREGRGEQGHSAVLVTGVQPGFPAAEMLQAGDRIIAIDDQLFPVNYSFEDFRGQINQRRAGTILQVTVLREGRQLKMGVQLAGLSDEEMGSVGDFVSRRQTVSNDYVRTLRTGLSNDAVVIKDDSPAEVMNGGMEFEDP